MDKKFDGDMSSYDVCYSDNAIAEKEEYLNSKRAYVNASGKLIANPTTDTLAYVLFNLTA